MPRADFRLKGDVLDRDAATKVLAVMCHPTSVRDREAILRHPPPKVVVPRHAESPGAPSDLWTGELWDKFVLHRRVAVLAGTVVLALAQLSAFGQPGERRTILPLAGSIYATFQQALDRTQASDAARRETMSEEHISEAYKTYKSVSHLWAAVAYGAIQGRASLDPLSVGRLPSFLAYADEIARLATALNWLDPDDDLMLAGKTLWTFILPASVTSKAETLPLRRSDEEVPLPSAAQSTRAPN